MWGRWDLMWPYCERRRGRSSHYGESIMSSCDTPFAVTVNRPSPLVRTAYSSIGLLYLFFPAVDIAHHHGWVVVPAIVTLVAFMVVYVATVYTAGDWRFPARSATWYLLGLAGVITIGAPAAFGAAWSGLFIYLSILCAMNLPMRWVLRGIGAVTLLAVAEAALLGARGTDLAFMGIGTGSMGLFMMAFRNSRMLNHELRAARDEVARLAAAEERLRIARDLHDLLGHSLSLIVLKSEVAKRIGEHDHAKVLGEVADIESVARQALADVRETVSGYRQRNLAEELDNARSVLEAAGMDVSMQLAGNPLPDLVDELFAWATREGVTNVIRHSRASRCQITVRRARSLAELTIADNGDASTFTGPGNGLTGLTERIAAIGGSVTAAPAKDGGFHLSVRAPLTAAQAPAHS